MEIPSSISSPKNEYLYNKKELQENLGLYDYGARFYDPVIIDQKGSATRVSFIGLGHELGHVQDMWNGITKPGIWFTNSEGVDIDNSDKYATYKENQIRADHGVALRTYYDPNQYESRVINGKENNLWFRGNPIMPVKIPVVSINPASIPFAPIK